MKWKLLLVTMLACSSIALNAQRVGYSISSPSYLEGQITYSVVKQDSTFFIVVRTKTDKLNFTENTTMKVRTFQGDVMEFQGIATSTDVVLGMGVISSTAQFQVSPEQFLKLKDGVQKIRLYMIPSNHERKFKKDKIGKKLYKLYLKTEGADADF